MAPDKVDDTLHGSCVDVLTELTEGRLRSGDTQLSVPDTVPVYLLEEEAFSIR